MIGASSFIEVINCSALCLHKHAFLVMAINSLRSSVAISPAKKSVTAIFLAGDRKGVVKETLRNCVVYIGVKCAEMRR